MAWWGQHNTVPWEKYTQVFLKSREDKHNDIEFQEKYLDNTNQQENTDDSEQPKTNFQHPNS